MIQTLNNNLNGNESNQVDMEEDEGNTFITNMINTDEPTNNSSLPTISKRG